MSGWSEVLLSDLGNFQRIDAEYYQPELLELERALERSGLEIKPLGELVAEGCRVVYETTDIIEEPVDGEDHVRFLQAADINRRLPTLRRDSVGWVSRKDWDRYPKGRIKPGEILIEVKGKAEKVGYVPAGYPSETLVTGTVFKLTLRGGELRPLTLVAYLLSRFGRGLRSRCLTNTLIGYVSKPELYAIKVPILPSELDEAVSSLIEASLSAAESSERKLKEAELLVAQILGMPAGEVPQSETSYTAKFSDAVVAGRIDAEYFQPAKRSVLDQIAAEASTTVGAEFEEIREIVQMGSLQDGLVRNYDLTDALDPFLDDTKPEMPAADLGSLKKRLRPGDLVVSRLRSYLREVALVSTSPSSTAVGSSEFIVLRRTGRLSAETLLAFVRSAPIQVVLQWSQDGSNHPRFSAAELLRMPLPKQLFDRDAEIAALVRDAVRERQRAYAGLDEATQRVERAIDGGVDGTAP